MKKAYIETLGCAMNHKDSENMFAELKNENYESTSSPENADLIIINTCSVREKPVKKLFSELGHLNRIRKSDSKIGVAGCTASHLGKEIIQKARYVDFVLGARNVSKIRDVLKVKGAVETDIANDDSLYSFAENGNSSFQSSINISIGCDKKCSFCIVPHTRGTEISIPTDLIISQVRKDVERGVKEFLLLGQNVNNYGRRFSQNHEKTDFTKLLQEVSKVDGVERIRFTSPHPLHMDDNFIEEFATNPKIAKSIHMPLQSGSTEILKAMRRGYSKDWFLNRAEKIRKNVDEVAISTDVIVGFPNESDSDFMDTLDVLEAVRFEQMFSFKYSPRPFTEAEKLPQIPDEIASARLKKLQSRHLEIMNELAESRFGKTYKVLFNEEIEGCLIGRSSEGYLVKSKGDSSLLGKVKNVKISKTMRTTLHGEIV
ncbi:tRNA-N(6)-(isopentenyl)adenosine-37 thiotransferase enzyme MiaB [Thiovulum sp. ES]|nr:tRNA-N(6)-(isopentenyl)adenosine-37 thiotransferase enzyme MiaB [Thiovulum sp. ES]